MRKELETHLLPGYSAKNKIWADETKNDLAPEIPVRVVDWPHWQEGVEKEEDWITKEAEKIVALADESKIKILAKSVGTLVALAFLNKRPDLVEKLILCGVPISAFEPGDEKYFEALKSFPTENLLVIQNENDTVSPHKQVQEFLQSINPSINVLSKPRDDHGYPYSEDFKAFLAN